MPRKMVIISRIYYFKKSHEARLIYAGLHLSIKSWVKMDWPTQSRGRQPGINVQAAV